MLLLVLLTMCTFITLSGACSCPPFFSKDRFCEYPVIVRGMALAEYEERPAPYDPKDPLSVHSPHNDFVYSIGVTQAIKLPDSLKGRKTISIRTPVQSSMCGTRFSLDVDAVFFGDINSKGEIRTGICHPTMAWDSMLEEDKKFFTEEISQFCSNDLIGPPGSRPLPPGNQPPGSGSLPPGGRRP